MMKKITLFFTLLCISAVGISQDFGGTYPNCEEPVGYTFGQGARISPYINPYKGAGCAGGENDCGIITPGVGGNNPANVIFPAVSMPAGTTGLSRCFSIFVFDANLKCDDRNFACDTYVTAYIVSESYNSTTAPSPSEYYGVSEKKLVQAHGAPNCVSVFFNPATPPDPNQKYRVFLDFTNDGTCNQFNTKYILDILAQGGPVPIRLVTFNGVKDDTKVQLKWQTSSEQNSKHFDVEFSENGSQWSKIGTVQAAGNSTVQRNYALPHNSPVDGTNYYRLKQVDATGNYSYSNIVAINFTIKGVKITSVFPNPFISQLKIKVSSDRNEVIRIQLNDNAGRILRVQNASIQKGVSDHSIDNLAGLAPGIYNVEVRTSFSTFRYKLKK